jgi:putative ABC transport system substrate-binding protein
MLSRPGLLLAVFLGSPLLFTVVPTSEAQQTVVPRVGFLGGGRAGTPDGEYLIEAFRRGLRDLGWVEGQSVAVEWRYARGQDDKLPSFAAELVGLKVHVIVVGGADPAIRAAKEATTSIPIVMAVSTDPVRTGLVASLARPGGNVTGLSINDAEVAGKRLELIRKLSPRLLAWPFSGMRHILGRMSSWRRHGAQRRHWE